ncbi:hypothetical protein Csa_017473 [Cucumis sativus]|nr:hypothetical protein Csa_017473 [Cucumis sativus]
MKLLGWMHNKFWQSGIESVKDFTIANPCMCLTLQKPVDDEDIYLKPGFGFTTVQSDSRNYEQSSLGVEANNVLEKCGDLSNSSDIFHGFLTIGTLGSEPATPTFSLAFENMIELPDEVTEDDLKLINYELEKFLEAETKEDRCDQSPGRTSHASIITLAGKHMEETKDENDGKTTCPLQGYLFGSTIELPDKMIDMRKETPSSPELFQDTIAENESFKLNIEKKKALVKHSNKSALTFVKKMLKKLCTSSHGSSTYDSGDSHSTKKKLQKKYFHVISKHDNFDWEMGGTSSSTLELVHITWCYVSSIEKYTLKPLLLWMNAKSPKNTSLRMCLSITSIMIV